MSCCLRGRDDVPDERGISNEKAVRGEGGGGGVWMGEIAGEQRRQEDRTCTRNGDKPTKTRRKQWDEGQESRSGSQQPRRRLCSDLEEWHIRTELYMRQ